MMNNTLLDEVLTEYYDDYLSKYADVPEHKFSLRHRLKMKKIFRLYEKNVQKLYHEPAVKQHEIGKVRFNRKTVLVIVVIVMLSIIAGCAVVYFVSESFRGAVHDDNTQLFAINVEGAPTTIEYTYELSDLPQGFELIESHISDNLAYTNYYNKESGKTIVIKQYVKSEFFLRYNTEQNEFQSVEINGYEVISLEINNNNGKTTILTWDNGDYIIEIVSELDSKTLVHLAKTTKIQNR